MSLFQQSRTQQPTAPLSIEVITARTVDECQQHINEMEPVQDDLHAEFTLGPDGTAFELSGTLPRVFPRLDIRITGTLTPADAGTHVAAQFTAAARTDLTTRKARMERLSQGLQGIMIGMLALSFMDTSTTLMMMVVNTIALAGVLYLHFMKLRMEAYLLQLMTGIAQGEEPITADEDTDQDQGEDED